MAINNDLPLPPELKAHCFDFVSDLQIGQVSKKFCDIFEVLEKQYRVNELLGPIIESMVDRTSADISFDIPFSHSKEFVKRVYERVIAEAKRFPESEGMLKRTRESHGSQQFPSTLSSLRLQEVVEWTERSKNAQDIAAILKRVARNLPEADDFLLALNSANLTATERIRQMRQWMNEHHEALATVEYLDLSGLHLTYLPPEIGLFQNLITFNLSSNQLTTVPAELGNLRQLKALYLQNNELTKVPVELENLRQLEVLNLNQNPLIELPARLRNLSQLEVPQLPSDATRVQIFNS